VTSDAGPNGQIITFFSYKGGTGRSMALANVAWLLASAGRRVLMIDWDLEAPGLHRYVHPFLSDPELVETPGLIEFFLEFAGAAIASARPDDDRHAWFQHYKDPINFTVSVDFPFPDVGGRRGYLDLIPAGRQDTHYSLRVNGFNWDRFYTAFGGGVFLEAVKHHLRKQYDYILIDSRTGVSDTAGICTVQMPDDLVACFTLNRQSIHGCAAVARSAISQRTRPDGSPGLRVWPLPMRIEDAEKEKRDQMQAQAAQVFGDLMPHVSADRRERYWGEIGIRYQPFYAYEEVLAVFGDRPHTAGSMLTSLEAIVRHLSGGAIATSYALPEAVRQGWLAKYVGAPLASTTIGSAQRPIADAGAFVFYVSYAHSDRAGGDDHMLKFFGDLEHELRIASGGSVSLWIDQATAGRSFAPPELEAEMQRSNALLALVSPAYARAEWPSRELAFFIARRRPIVSVVWVPVVESAITTQLRNFQLAVDHESYVHEGLRRMMQLRRYERDYVELVSDLARRMVEIARTKESNGEKRDPVRAQLRQLADRYVETRRLMTASRERTLRMEEIAAEMRGLAPLAGQLVPELMASEQSGERLAAIAMLQAKPDRERLDWLSACVDPATEQPFIGYHAAIALRAACRQLPLDDLPAVEKSLRRALDTVSGRPDSGRDRTLRLALGELQIRARAIEG
jgi:hypothetical protein